MIRKILASLAALALCGCTTATTVPTPVPAPSAETVTPAAETVTSAAETPQETVAPDLTLAPVPLTDSSEPIDYSKESSWCYFGTDPNARAEAFLINGTIYHIPVGNAELTDDLLKKQQSFINRLSGMVSDRCTIYAPHFREATIASFVSPRTSEYTDYAYKDISASFRYYLQNVHKPGTPIVLLGFSQGAIMEKMLLMEYFSPDSEEAAALREDLVCAYVIGYGVEKALYDENPNLKPATGKDDLGVIVSFDAETPEVTDSITLRRGTEYVQINPLNWKTDSTRASAMENPGAVLVNGKGEIKFEQEHFCGAYLDDTPRHALKIDDLKYENYPNLIEYFPVGGYHAYDITFFYRSIEQNVNDRVDAWFAKH